jgi:hypothetical protein
MPKCADFFQNGIMNNFKNTVANEDWKKETTEMHAEEIDCTTHWLV